MKKTPNTKENESGNIQIRNINEVQERDPAWHEDYGEWTILPDKTQQQLTNIGNHLQAIIDDVIYSQDEIKLYGKEFAELMDALIMIEKVYHFICEDDPLGAMHY